MDISISEKILSKSSLMMNESSQMQLLQVRGPGVFASSMALTSNISAVLSGPPTVIRDYPHPNLFLGYPTRSRGRSFFYFLFFLLGILSERIRIDLNIIPGFR